MPELLQAVVVGMLADDELLVPVEAGDPAGIDVVGASYHGLEDDPGEVHCHIVHAVVVKMVRRVHCCQVLVRGGVELCRDGELLLQRLPTGEACHGIPCLVLHVLDEVDQVGPVHSGLTRHHRLTHNLQQFNVNYSIHLELDLLTFW